MSYEPDGLRVKLEESTRTKIFIWDGQAYLGETDETNTTSVVYTHEQSYYGNIVSQYRKTDSIWLPTYYHQDALGSTTQLTDSSDSFSNTYQYDGWGVVVALTETTENPFQFTGDVGYYSARETDSIYIRARFYQQTTGRWSSVDPLGFVDGINFYAVTFIPSIADPSGHFQIQNKSGPSGQQTWPVPFPGEPWDNPWGPGGTPNPIPPRRPPALDPCEQKAQDKFNNCYAKELSFYLICVWAWGQTGAGFIACSAYFLNGASGCRKALEEDLEDCNDQACVGTNDDSYA